MHSSAGMNLVNGLVRLSSLTASDGTVADFAAARIVVVVGPNNSGKTQLLREISTELVNADRHIVTDAIVYEFADVGESALIEWLERERPNRILRGSRHFRVNRGGNEISETELTRSWSKRERHMGALGQALHSAHMIEQRLEAVSEAERMDFGVEAASDPVQRLVEDESMFNLADAAVQSAFGRALTLHPFGRRYILKLSEDPIDLSTVRYSRIGMPNAEDRALLDSLPAISGQGHGLRAFVNLLLGVISYRSPILLIDEPEAFLHPPQALVMGRLLANLEFCGGQLIVATHSGPVLEGILSAAPNDVVVVRLTRDKGGNHMKMLGVEQLSELWGDPLLKESRALDGLFHEGVVVCEGPTDAQFYRSVSEGAAPVLEPSRSGKHPDLLFTSAGGKSAMHRLARALNALGVPVRVISDFDLLQNQDELKNVVEALGGNLSSDLVRDRAEVDAAVRGSEKVPQAKALLRKLGAILDKTPGDVSRAQLAALRAALEPSAGWRSAKHHGVAALKGSAHKAAQRVVGTLTTMGLFLVPNGTAESFVRGAAGESGQWLANVWSSREHLNPDSDHGRFVGEVIDSFGR